MKEQLSRSDDELKLHKIRTKIAMLQYLYARGIVDDNSKLVHNEKFMKYGDVIDSLVEERDLLEAELGVDA